MMVHMEIDVQEPICNIDVEESENIEMQGVTFVKTRKSNSHRPNECLQCDKAFTKPCDLRRHVNR